MCGSLWVGWIGGWVTVVWNIYLLRAEMAVLSTCLFKEEGVTTRDAEAEAEVKAATRVSGDAKAEAVAALRGSRDAEAEAEAIIRVSRITEVVAPSAASDAASDFVSKASR